MDAQHPLCADAPIHDGSWRHAAGVDPLVSLRTLVHRRGRSFAAATLLTILTVHEFGHYFAARSWGVKASLPTFYRCLHIVSRHIGRCDQNSFGISAQCALLDTLAQPAR